MQLLSLPSLGQDERPARRAPRSPSVTPGCEDSPLLLSLSPVNTLCECGWTDHWVRGGGIAPAGVSGHPPHSWNHLGVTLCWISPPLLPQESNWIAVLLEETGPFPSPAPRQVSKGAPWVLQQQGNIGSVVEKRATLPFRGPEKSSCPFRALRRSLS